MEETARLRKEKLLALKKRKTLHDTNPDGSADNADKSEKCAFPSSPPAQLTRVRAKARGVPLPQL